jgi:hypothetical protein
MKRVVLACLSVAVCTAGCGDRGEKAPPPVAQGAPTASPSPRPLPTIDTEKTKALFARISGKQIGDQVGRVEMRDLGILVHPGATTATRVEFKLGKKVKALTLAGFICPLPEEARTVAQAGTVSVLIQADGRELDTVAIDRDSRYEKRLDLQGAEVLTVTVSNGDGKMWWDWFHLGVVGQE